MQDTYIKKNDMFPCTKYSSTKPQLSDSQDAYCLKLSHTLKDINENYFT